MTNPAVTITGTLTDVGGNALQGKVIFSLANQGSSIPRVAGTDILAQTTYEADANASGVWSATVFGNYQLTNTNTWYSVAIYKNSTQGGADSIDNYQFNVPGTFDLSNLSPISANPTVQPTQPLTAIVTNPTGVQTINTYALNVPGLMINGTAPVGSVLVGTGSQYTASFQGTKISVKDYPQSGVTPGQAKGVRLAASISSGAAILTLAAGTKYTFSAGDVGKKIKVVGAGAGGGDLYTTILTFTSTTQVTLNANASTSVSSATAVWWTIGQDTTDRTALEAASNAQDSQSALLLCPSGFYLYDQTPSLNANFKGLIGDGIRDTFWCASNASAGTFMYPGSTTPPRWGAIGGQGKGFSIYGPGFSRPFVLSSVAVASNVLTAVGTVPVALPVGGIVLTQLLLTLNGRSCNNQFWTITSSSITGFTATLNAGQTVADFTTTADVGIASLDINAIKLGSGPWFYSIEEIETYGFPGSTIQSQTPILNTWKSIWGHNNGGPTYNIMAAGAGQVGATVHGMDGCYALTGYGPGMYGGSLQSTTIKNCAFEICGGLIILDSCEGVTITSPHLEQPTYQNTALPGMSIDMRGCRACVVIAPFMIQDSGGNVAQTTFNFNSAGTVIHNCQQNSIINPIMIFSSVGGAVLPTSNIAFTASASWNEIVEPQILAGANPLTFTDAGTNNSIMYQGSELLQGKNKINLTGATAAKATINLIEQTQPNTSPSLVLNDFPVVEMFQTPGDTQPCVLMTDNVNSFLGGGGNGPGFAFGPGGVTAPDFQLWRATSGMVLWMPAGKALLINEPADASSRIALALDGSGNPSVSLSIPGGNQSYLNLQGANNLGIGSGPTSANGTLTAANVVSTSLITAAAVTTSALITAASLKVSGNAGFYGTTPISKPTITGAKAGNTALASLLTQLAALGLITDSTT